MEIEKEERSPTVRDSESSDDEISRHLENSQQSTPSIQSVVDIHGTAELPLPFGFEEGDDVIFIDPSSREGKRFLSDPETTVPEIFAVMRQSVSPVANHIDAVVQEMLKRKVGVNDIDVTLGMSILHYVIRSEAISSDQSKLVGTISLLLQNGANPFQRTLYTDMNAFHVAAYFNCWQSLRAIFLNLNSDEIEEALRSMSSEFDFGTPLHVATANQSVNVAEFLIKNGADIMSEDECGRTPESCIPASLLSDDERGKAAKLRRILKVTTGFFAINSSGDPKTDWTESHSSHPSNKDSQHSDKKKDLQVGDYVVVGGTKRGYIKFIGITKFSPGIWCGVELDDNIGKNDGSINGIRYFTCEKTRGVFAPLNKVTAVKTTPQSRPSKSRSSSSTSVASQQKSTHSFSKEKIETKLDVELRTGMTVMLDKTKEAKIKFIGETDFAPGLWIGLSFTKPIGKNNGTVQGREYFRCKPNHGVMVRRSRVFLLHHTT